MYRNMDNKDMELLMSQRALFIYSIMTIFFILIIMKYLFVHRYVTFAMTETFQGLRCLAYNSHEYSNGNFLA